MKIQLKIRAAVFAVLFLGSGLLEASGASPSAVSPGSDGVVLEIDARCPTFSWGEEDDAAAYELVAYALPEELSETVELTLDREVLHTRVVGSATSWTPSADHCFASGGQYVWFVRAVYSVIDDQVIDASEWSEGLFFETPAGPTEDELQHALDVLRRWESAGGSVDGEQRTANGERRSAIGNQRSAWASDSDSGAVSDSDSDSATGPSKSVPTASAAIRGAHPATSGEVYGVVGVSDSPSGAGLGAVNTNGGPDLVLDGTSDERADAFLDETGWRRNSPNDETFALENTGAGLMHLDVGGYVFADTVDTEEIKIAGSTVIDDTGEWMGQGSTVPCTSCVGSSDIADGGVASIDLADDAVTHTKIADANVRSNHLALNAVQTAAIADDAVTGAKIFDGAVGYRELASDAVRTGHILDGEVGTSDLASNAVDSSKILNGSVTSNDLADDTITYRDLADGAVTEPKLADGAVTGAKIADGGVNGAKVSDGTIGGVDIAALAITTNHLAASAVTSAKISDETITSADIADGTLSAADVDPIGGVYASKSAVYVETVSGTLPDYACANVDVSCLDTNDLALQGGHLFPVVTAMKIMQEDPVNWETTDQPAKIEMTVCNETNVPQDFTLKIVCVAVPGP